MLLFPLPIVHRAQQVLLVSYYALYRVQWVALTSDAGLYLPLVQRDCQRHNLKVLIVFENITRLLNKAQQNSANMYAIRCKIFVELFVDLLNEIRVPRFARMRHLC